MDTYPRERLTPQNTALLLVDHQAGLVLGVHDADQQLVRRNAVALARTAKLHGIPAVLTTSADYGPNGPIFPELRTALPDAPFIRRDGEVDAFDNADFANAVRATGAKKLVIAGIASDVCLAFASLSAKSLGYEVVAVPDASGTWNVAAAEITQRRLVAAGITLNTTVGVISELLVSWKTPAGAGTAEIFAGGAIPFYADAIALKVGPETQAS